MVQKTVSIPIPRKTKNRRKLAEALIDARLLLEGRKAIFLAKLSKLIKKPDKYFKKGIVDGIIVVEIRRSYPDYLYITVKCDSRRSLEVNYSNLLDALDAKEITTYFSDKGLN